MIVDTLLSLLYFLGTMSLKQLENKTVWILGASSGIGKQLALICAQNHARVLLTDPSFDGVERVFAQVRRVSPTARIVMTDFTTPDNAEKTVKAVIKKHGPVYLVIDNMSISGKDKFLDIDEDLFSEKIEKRLKSLTFMIKAILPSMIADGGGRIAFTGNVGGLYSGCGSTCSSIVQYAVEGLFKSVRSEHRGDKISLSIISPVSILTEMGTGDSIRNSLVYRANCDKKYLIMDSRKCAFLYLKRILRGQKKILINHKLAPLLFLLKKMAPPLFEKIVGFGFY